MGDFFHGWRQKAGCVALTMELVVFAAWMRSYNSPDSIGEKQTPWLISHDGIIVLASQSGPYNYPLIWDWYGFYTTDPAIFAQGYRREFEWKCVSRRGSVGLELGCHEFSGYAVDWLRVPYWTILLPISLLSANLILGKPGQIKESRRRDPV
ncbi:MAG: hypothetical protein U0941_23325 [Planctomycetaceae bacterium]